jgi:hypothetical protein
MLRLLADELIALGVVEYISHVTVEEVLKKKDEALARESLVHSQTQRALRG